MKRPHQILNVSENADQKTIKAAYRKLIKKAHPDAGGTAEQFQEIQQAYETLTGKRQPVNDIEVIELRASWRITVVPGKLKYQVHGKLPASAIGKTTKLTLEVVFVDTVKQLWQEPMEVHQVTSRSVLINVDHKQTLIMQMAIFMIQFDLDAK